MFESKIPKYRVLSERYNLDFKVLKNGVQMVVFMSTTHPLSKVEHVYIADIVKYALVIDTNLDYDNALELLSTNDPKSNILYICDRGSVFDAIRKGDYLSIGLNIAPGDANALKCVVRQLEDGEKLAFCLANSRELNLSTREEEFILYFSQQLDKYFS